MHIRLLDWGYYASQSTCREWICSYRLVLGGIDGNASVYTLSRQDLQKWYYVEKLSPTEIQKRYLMEHGVYAHRNNLMTWLKADAQKPEKLEFNECIHSHAAGEYVLLSLQRGIRAHEVVATLMSRYLVEASLERVVAYRCYREQLGKYWSMRRLERLQWEYLYSKVSIDSKYGGKSRHLWQRRQRALLEVRVDLCASMHVAEELIPLDVLDHFYRKHEEYARLPHKYPQAVILKDTLPIHLIKAYRSTFGPDEVLPDVGFQLTRPEAYGISTRATQVAEASGYIAFPRACGDAALVAAYAMQKCSQLYQQQCFFGSKLSSVQRDYPNAYPKVDFRFWVMYGSWSICPHCRSLFFNDQYFKESVYQLRVTSTSPDLLSPLRRQLPYDPSEHSYGNVADSSRWWYLFGMYQPSVYCTRCTRPGKNADPTLMESMALRTAQYTDAQEQSKKGKKASSVNTGSLYRIPYVGTIPRMAHECITWPRYDAGVFSFFNRHGVSMLELTEQEQWSLQVVCLKSSMEKQLQTGSSFNWKKTGLTRAYYRKDKLYTKDMTPRAAAAFEYLQANNVYYDYFLKKHNDILKVDGIRQLSSYSLFIVEKGIECAIRPHLYPTKEFTDTDIKNAYQTDSGDYSKRVASTGLSVTRKACSSVRAYAEDY